MQSISDTLYSYVVYPVELTAKTGFDIVSKVAFKIFDLLRSIVMAPVHFFFPPAEEGSPPPSPLSDVVDEVQKRRFSDKNIEVQGELPIFIENAPRTINPPSPGSDRDVPPNSPLSEREAQMNSDSWESTSGGSNSVNSSALTQVILPFDQTAGKKSPSLSSEEEENSDEQMLSPIVVKGDEEIKEDATRKSLIVKSDGEMLSPITEESNEEVPSSKRSSPVNDPTEDTGTVWRDRESPPTIKRQDSLVSEGSEDSIRPLSEEEKNAISSFVLGKQSSMRNVFKSSSFEAAKTTVYNLNPVAVVEYIASNEELLGKVNPRDSRWNHLRNSFVFNCKITGTFPEQENPNTKFEQLFESMLTKDD